MGKLILFFFLAFLIGVLGMIRWQSLKVDQLLSTAKLTINNQTLKVELAQTEREITAGLGGREGLAENQGMLFVFAKPGNYQFWMKGMKFSLDAVFIKGEKVVHLVENIPYPKNGEQPRTFGAKEEFDKVLEMNSGMIRKIGIKVGDIVKTYKSDKSY